MKHLQVFVIPLFIILLLGVITLPVLALDYNPGVSVGQYVKYGNFVGSGSGTESFNDYSWTKLAVISVSGKEVTLLSTGQLKDGTAIPGNGTTEVWNIETGTQNGTPSTQGPIMAANINQGDPIPPANTYAVNRTENRVYLGVSRTVNILETTVSTPDYSTSLTYVYDKQSGVLLESTVNTVQNQPQQSTSSYFYRIVETNVFGHSPLIGWPLVFILIAVAIALALVIVVVLVLSGRKKYR